MRTGRFFTVTLPFDATIVTGNAGGALPRPAAPVASSPTSAAARPARKAVLRST